MTAQNGPRYFQMSITPPHSTPATGNYWPTDWGGSRDRPGKECIPAISCRVIRVRLSQQFLVACHSTDPAPSSLLPTVNIPFFCWTCSSSYVPNHRVICPWQLPLWFLWGGGWAVLSCLKGSLVFCDLSTVWIAKHRNRQSWDNRQAH